MITTLIGRCGAEGPDTVVSRHQQDDLIRPVGNDGLESRVARREGARIHTRSTGARGAHHEPIRTCVGCRTRTWASELLRVVAEDGHAAVPDPRRRRSGRGAWLHPDPACLRLAERRRAFPRALRVPGRLELSAVQAHVEHVAHDVTGAGSPRTRQLKEAGRPVMNQP
ncbi:YlxR family protein [Haloactinomyces albus]|uniref:YlxR family protein n=1 Tax=Haloactinomyces albus TaxID=1352928 RepID=UPI0035B53001